MIRIFPPSDRPPSDRPPSDRKSVRSLTLALALATAALTGQAVQGEVRAAGTGANAGLLTCHSLPDTRVNWILYSSVGLRCVFDTPRGQELYAGKTGIGLGVDLSWRPEAALRFVVLMASTDVEIGSHALAGHYAGGSASASVGATLGVSVLVGGGPESISLKPLAVETGSGLGVAAGLSYLTLTPSY